MLNFILFCEQIWAQTNQTYLFSLTQLEQNLKFATHEKADCFLKYADFLFERGEYAKAQRYYYRAGILGACSDRVFASIALVNVKSDKLHKAYEMYKNLLKDYPASPYAYDGLHELAYRCKDINDKEKVLKLIVDSYPEASQAAYLLGELYYNRGRFREAVFFFDRVSTTSAYYKSAIAMKSFAYYHLGSYSQSYQLAQTISPGTYTYLWLGFLNYKVGDYSKSVEFFNKVDNEYGYFNLGCVGLVTESYNDSIKYFTKAGVHTSDTKLKEEALYGKFLAFLYGDNFEEGLLLIDKFCSHYKPLGYFALAEKYFKSNMFKKAAFYYRLCLLDSKETQKDLRERSLLKLAISMCLSGEYIEADKLFERFHRDYPGSEFYEIALYWWGCNDYMRGLYTKAKDKFEALFDSHNDTLASYSIYNAAASYFNLKKYNVSINLYTKLQQHYPKGELCKKAKYMSALSLYKLNNFEDALSVFYQLSREHPEYTDHAEYFVGLCYFKLCKFSHAISVFKRLTNTKDQQLRSQSLSFLANCYYNEGDYKQAVEVYLRLLESCQEKLRAEVYYRLGDCYLMLGDLEGAILHFRKSAMLGDFSISNLARLRIPQLYKQKGNINQAIKEYQNALAYIPAGFVDECYLGLGESFMEVGQLDQAIEQFLKISKDSSYYYDAQLKIGICYFHQKNYEKAKYYFKKVAKLGKERQDLSREAEYYLELCPQ